MDNEQSNGFRNTPASPPGFHVHSIERPPPGFKPFHHSRTLKQGTSSSNLPQSKFDLTFEFPLHETATNNNFILPSTNSERSSFLGNPTASESNPYYLYNDQPSVLENTILNGNHCQFTSSNGISVSSQSFYGGSTTSISNGNHSTSLLNPGSQLNSNGGEPSSYCGVYSHFGPQTSFVSGFPFGINKQQTLNGKNIKAATPSIPSSSLQYNSPIHSELDYENGNMTVIRSSSLSDATDCQNLINPGNINHFEDTVESQKAFANVVVSPQPSPVMTEKAPPSKPSYSEILSKNVRKDDNEKVKLDEEVGKNFYPFGQIQNHPQRKSFDGFSPTSSSPTFSNPSTASSSPLAKPRYNQKGKENTHSNSSTTTPSTCSSKKSTPASSPTHQNYTTSSQKINSTKKVLKSPDLKKAESKQATVFDPATVSGVSSSNEICDVNNFDAYDKPVIPLSSNPKKREKRNHKHGNSLNCEPGNSTVERRISTESKQSSFQCNIKKGYSGKEKDKNRQKKIKKNCVARKLEFYSEQWFLQLMKVLKWLWTLVMSVTLLSVSLGYTLSGDVLIWWRAKAYPFCHRNAIVAKQKLFEVCRKLRRLRIRKSQKQNASMPQNFNEVLSALGPERNIALPSTRDEALKRLLGVKDKDPYCILGVRSDCSDETIRRYYKKQAVLVHPDKNAVPGAEEAFKILAKAFEMIGNPATRQLFHHNLLEAHAKEKFWGEFGELFDELRKKMETVCSTIRCTKCKGNHKKNKTNRPLFASRYCELCKIHHSAREGELWAEKTGIFSFSWQFYTCIGNQIWEINEWARCQRSSLKHLKPNAHNVVYRLVSGRNQAGKMSSKASPGDNGIGSGSNSSTPFQDTEDVLDPLELDQLDSLLHSLYRNSGNPTASAWHYQTQNGGSHFKSGGNTGSDSSSVNSNGRKKRNGKRK